MNTHPQNGFTLIELMITVAILTIVATIAIPAYNGYITEARLGTMRMNLDTLRISLEDYQLDNGTYGSGVVTGTTLENTYGWSPDGDHGQYSYSVSAGTTSYDVWAVNDATGLWIRCDDRMDSCCSGSGRTVSACLSAAGGSATSL